MANRLRRITLREGTVLVVIRGSGPPLLLLHGLSAHSQVWDRVAGCLEERYTLCLPDLLSRGGSEARPDIGYGLKLEIERLFELLHQLELSPRIVVGHSHGAALAIALAHADDGVTGLVLANPVTPWTPRPLVLAALRWSAVRRAAAMLLPPVRRPLVRYVLGRAYGPGHRPDRAIVRRYADPFSRRLRAQALLRAVSDWRPAELADHLPARDLTGRVLVGERDRRIGVHAPAALASRLGLGFEVLAGVGHVIPEEQPEAIAQAVEEVSRQIDERGEERTTG